MTTGPARAYMTDFIDRIERASTELLSRGQRIVVAVSGGVDSMVLLHALHRLAAAQQWRLTVAHLNHRLRGRSSDADQRLVERAAQKLKLPTVAERADIQALAAAGKGSIEMVARRVRHEFLAHVAKENNIPTVALAHHADDQVELFFLRLLRGAGGDGLSGMEPAAASPVDPNVKIVRPLLGLSRADIQEFAHQERILFREDASNRSTDHMRNRVRHELLPLLERKFQPAIRGIVLRTIDLLSADADFSWHGALDWLARRAGNFDSLHLAVQRRVLQDQLIELGIAPDFALIERLRYEPEQLISVAPDKFLVRDRAGHVQVKQSVHFDFHENQVEIDLESKSRSLNFDGLELSWKLRIVKSPAILRRAGREQFDAEAIGTRILVRHWREGDRFQPIGMSSAVKLQDLFANAKIPKAERHQRAVATTAAGEIFWVEGLRISEGFKLRAATRRVVEWRWRRNSGNG
jgi:tRNA(Ile)-lysidine synthase